MRLLEAQTTIRLDGQLERHRGKRRIKPTTPTVLSDNATIQADSAVATLLSIHVAMQEIYHAKSHILLVCRVTSGKYQAKVTINYLRCRRVSVETIVVGDTGNSTSKETSDPFELSIHHYNEIKIRVPIATHFETGRTLKIVCQFADKDWEKSFKGLVRNLSVQLFDSSESKVTLTVKPTTLLVVPQISHFLELTELSLVQAQTKGFRSQKAHFIPKLRTGPKMLVCHDMAGGYREDVNEYSIVGNPHNYRFHHFGVTDIFIYFSHYNFAPPTRAWVEACHSNNVLCVGTFIIEHELDYVRNETADYLVYLAREYEFDGYLINIQYKLANVPAFKSWLKYLVKEMHTQLPNSILIFYDSVTNAGELKWQSQLNEKNLEYFEICDYFFTDYHWNLEKLQEGWAFAESLQRTNDVFVGTDIWGRGTFGGGKFESYKGVTEARKLGFSVALFAQGFTYQNGAMDSLELFELQDDSLFFGKKFVQVKVKDDMWKLVKQGGNGWKKQGDDWVTSFDWCQRQWVFPIDKALRNSNTVLTFLAEVKGTPPKVDDPFRIALEGFLEGGMSLVNKTQSNYEQFSPATSQWRLINITVHFKTFGSSANKLQQVRITEVGKDQERWGGFYGSRFKNERLIISSYDEKMDISAVLGQAPLTALPYHSYFNTGQGKYYYWRGHQTKNLGGKRSQYSCLRDYDLPYQDKSLDLAINSKQATSSVTGEQGWVGGSSIKLECLSDNATYGLFKLLNLSYSCSNGLSVMLKVKEGGRNKYNLTVNLKEGSKLNIAGKTIPVSNSTWTQVVFDVEPTNATMKSLVLQLNLQQKGEAVYLGELVVSDPKGWKDDHTQKCQYNVFVRQSPLKLRRTKHYVDLLIDQKLGLKNSSQTLPGSLVATEKARLVFINEQLKGSLNRNQSIHLIEAAKLDSTERLLIEIISINRMGSMRKDYSKQLSLKNKQFEWHQL